MAFSSWLLCVNCPHRFDLTNSKTLRICPSFRGSLIHVNVWLGALNTMTAGPATYALSCFRRAQIFHPDSCCLSSVLALVCGGYTPWACFWNPIAVLQFMAAQWHLPKPHLFTAHVVEGRPWVGLRDVDCHKLLLLPRLEVLEWFRSRSLRRCFTLPCSPLAAGWTPFWLDDVERENGYSRKLIPISYENRRKSSV